jgi:hypothetical protein
MTALFKSAAVVASLAVLVGCSEGRKPEECWSPGTKIAATELSKRIVVDHIIALVEASTGTPVNDERRKNFEQSTSIVLSDFYLTGATPEIRQLTCGANVKYTFKRTDGSTMSGDTMAGFAVMDSEGGPFVIVSPETLTNMVTTAGQ